MIKNILNLFKKEKKIINIDEKELKGKSEDIFNTYVEENIKNKLTENKKEINKIIEDIKHNEKSLENSKEKVKQLSKKEKQFIEGNMRNFINQINILINSLKIPSEYNNVSESYYGFKKNLITFQKHTIRSKHIIHHFLDDEISEIHNKIVELNKMFENNFSLTNNEEFKERSKLKEIVTSYYSEKYAKKQLKEDIQKSEKIIEKIEKQKKENLNKIEKIKISDSYITNEKLKKELNTITDKIKKNQNNLNADFSMLERPLKKIQRISIEFEKTITDYLANPFSAFIADSKRKGKSLLKKLKIKIENNEIEVNNKNKIINKIEELILDKYWDEKIKENTFLNDEKKDVESKLKLNDVEKDIYQLQNETKSLDLRLDEENNKLKILNDKLSENSEKKPLDNIKTQLEKILGCEVNIS